MLMPVCVSTWCVCTCLYVFPRGASYPHPGKHEFVLMAPTQIYHHVGHHDSHPLPIRNAPPVRFLLPHLRPVSQSLSPTPPLALTQRPLGRCPHQPECRAHGHFLRLSPSHAAPLRSYLGQHLSHPLDEVVPSTRNTTASSSLRSILASRHPK